MTGERVLLVTDSRDGTEFLLTQILTPQGFITHVANGVRAGLDVARAEPPQLVLLDLALNDMPHDEFLKHLQASGDLPVIMLAAPGTEATALKALQLGARGVIRQPFDVQEAEACIARVLHQEHRARTQNALLRKLAADNQQLEKTQATWQGLLAATRQLCSQQSRAEVHRTAVEAGTMATDADEGYLLLRDAEQGTLCLSAWYRRDTGEIWELDWPVDDRLARHVSDSHTPVIRSNPDGSPLLSHVRLPGQAGPTVYALMNIPLFHHNRVIGVLGVHRATVEKPFGTSELAALLELGHSVATALGNVQHLDHICHELALAAPPRVEPDAKDPAASPNSVVAVATTHSSKLATARRIQYKRAESRARGAYQDALAAVGNCPYQFVLLMHETLSTLHLDVASATKECHPITLRPIISEVIGQFKKASPERDFTVVLPPDLPFGMGVESKIELVLLNLVGTARSLSSPGDPVSVYADADVDSLIVNVEVRHGHQQPFFTCQFSEGRTCSVPNEPWKDVAPQIGLFIADKLIRAQGGRVWTESRSDVSTRFCFSLPKIEVTDVLQAFAD